MVKKGLVETRERAKHEILSGRVHVNRIRADKPGALVQSESNITLVGTAMPYVGRGGMKLQKALDKFDVQIKEKVFLDVGASTGGFTDCLLINGARKVYAVDVGYGQLAWKLRTDPRVVVMERINIRNATASMFENDIDAAVIDVSFISLRLVLPVVKSLIVGEGDIVALVKPQFEAGKDKVNKRGIVTNSDVHREVLIDIARYSLNIGLCIRGLDFSPIKGPGGNMEFLLHLRKPGVYDTEKMPDYGRDLCSIMEKAENVVKSANEEL